MHKSTFDKLSKEFKYLKDVEKPKYNQEKQIAAMQGDRSENAEYQAAKEQLRHIDKRLKFLSKTLNRVRIIDPSTLPTDKVSFGLNITLEDLDTENIISYNIVSEIESNPSKNHISLHSPIAKKLWHKTIGDIISINLPIGFKEYEILKIEYVNGLL